MLNLLRRVARWVVLPAFLLLLPNGQSAHAVPVTVSGLTFSEVGAGVTITSGSAGSGAQGDPIIINETFTSLDGTISIEGLSTFGNPTTSFQTHGFALEKIVTNNTGQSWEFFDHELQVTQGTPSSEGDGLSFAQGCATCRPFTSNNLPNVFEEIISRDFVNFSGGVVPDGGTVTFNYVITDNGTHSQVFLRERPNFAPPEAAVPEPGTFLLLGSSLTVVAGVLWKQHRKPKPSVC